MQERNALLLQSRKDDPVNKNVDSIAKNLNTAYTKYKEIVQNCSDGLTVCPFQGFGYLTQIAFSSSTTTLLSISAA